VDVQDLMLTVIRRIEVILILSNIYVVNLSFLDIREAIATFAYTRNM